MASRDYPPREFQSYHRDPRMAKANPELRGGKPSPVRNVEMRRTHEMNAKGQGLKRKYTSSDAGNRHSPERPGSQKRTGHAAIGPWGETKDYNSRPNLTSSSSRGSEPAKRCIPPGRINRAPRGQPANKLSQEGPRDPRGNCGIRPRGPATGKPNVAATGSASNKRYSPGAGSSVPSLGTRREVPSRDYSQPGPSAPYAPTTIQSSGPTVLVLERTDDALKASSGKRSWSKERPGCPEGDPGESATAERRGAGHGSVKDDSGDESDSSSCSGSSSGSGSSSSSSSSCESGRSTRDDFDKDENITPEPAVGTTVSESRNDQDARAESESARPESQREPEDTVSASTPAPFSADTRTVFYVPDPQRTREDAVSASNRAQFSADTRSVFYVPDLQRTTQEDAVSASNREDEFSDRESPDAASSLARSDPVCDADATASQDVRDTRVVGAPSCSESEPSQRDEIDRDSLDRDVEYANSYQDSKVSKAAHLRLLPKAPLTDTKLALGVPEPDRSLPLHEQLRLFVSSQMPTRSQCTVFLKPSDPDRSLPRHEQPQVPTRSQCNVFLKPSEPQPRASVRPKTTYVQQPRLGDTRSADTLMATVRRSVLCSSCEKTFNRSVVCNEYLIQLNRPIQCVCGCVLCTLCYREQEGCRAHNVSLQRGTVNTTASALASCPELENQGDWDLLLEPNDQFKTEREVNGDVRLVTNEEQAPDLEKLKTAYETLLAEKDSMSFEYWANKVMPLEMAHRYVCIPHLQGFWDHVLVGKCPPPDTDEMIAPDDHLPKLFNVSLGPYRFHWCCFVLKKQIVLAMWCTSGPRPKVLSLVDISLRKHTASPEFRSMVTYLSRWVTAQYVRPRGRQLKVVLDCKPSEGASLVHAVASLASKCGMKSVTLDLVPNRVTNDTNYSFNLKCAKGVFSLPEDVITRGEQINIMDEFKFNHEPRGGSLAHYCTASDCYSVA